MRSRYGGRVGGNRTGAHVALLLIWLYAFLVSISALGKSFKLLGGGFVDQILGMSAHPLVALLEGVLATTLVQSSSTTTSLVVALVAAGTVPVPTAIFMVMGANIGTTVTNTVISLGHITRMHEFRRAFAASTVHDFFNLMAVAVLFPLELATNILGRGAQFMTEVFQGSGGLKFASPIKLATQPVVDLLTNRLHSLPWMLLLVSLVLLFVALRQLVVTLKKTVMSRAESFFDAVVFKNPLRAMLLGLMLTLLVQSSSVTTSLVVPLAGAGLVTVMQIFPYTLGANVGTTVTTILAALATCEPVAVTVAFAHLLFNMSGIVLIWPIRRLREVPVQLAMRFADIAVRGRWLAIAYIVTAFYIVPLAVILGMR